MNWTGAPEQYRALLDSLHELKNNETNISAIYRSFIKFKSTSEFKKNYPDLVNLNIHQSTINRWMNKEKLYKSDSERCKLLFLFLFNNKRFPTDAMQNLALKHNFPDLFFCLCDFLQISTENIEGQNEFIFGKYKIYHYSQIFDDYSEDIPCGIVIGKILVEIDSAKNHVRVEEFQTYDGRLGRSSRSETNTGHCFVKNSKIYVVLKDEATGENLKLYVFHDLVLDQKTKKLQSLKGYMLKGAHEVGYFHSPAYALRSDTDDFECNIFLSEEVSDSIIRELNYGSKIKYASLGQNKSKP